MDLNFKVEAGQIISSDFSMNKGTAINGFFRDGKVLFKMQFSQNKVIENTFQGTLEANNPSHIKGTYKQVKNPDVVIETGGVLKVKVVSANVLEDTDIVGNMDPYVVINYQN